MVVVVVIYGGSGRGGAGSGDDASRCLMAKGGREVFALHTARINQRSQVLLVRMREGGPGGGGVGKAQRVLGEGPGGNWGGGQAPSRRIQSPATVSECAHRG